jgi:hypothetical protein
LVVEEGHVLFEDKVEDLTTELPRHDLSYDITVPANKSENGEVANCNNEEHERVEVALFYGSSWRELEGFDDA